MHIYPQVQSDNVAIKNNEIHKSLNQIKGKQLYSIQTDKTTTIYDY